MALLLHNGVYWVWSLESRQIEVADGTGTGTGDAAPFTADLCMHLEIEKHMVARFSVLELYLTTIGHVYGALMFHLLEMNRVHR